MCELDELRDMISDCKPSFVITDIDHVDSVQFAASAAQTGPSHHAINLNVRYAMC